ncbi:hypothetical protein YC2023_083174 [Brassica napus]
MKISSQLTRIPSIGFSRRLMHFCKKCFFTFSSSNQFASIEYFVCNCHIDRLGSCINQCGLLRRPVCCYVG